MTVFGLAVIAGCLFLLMTFLDVLVYHESMVEAFLRINVGHSYYMVAAAFALPCANRLLRKRRRREARQGDRR